MNKFDIFIFKINLALKKSHLFVNVPKHKFHQQILELLVKEGYIACFVNLGSVFRIYFKNYKGLFPFSALRKVSSKKNIVSNINNLPNYVNLNNRVFIVSQQAGVYLLDNKSTTFSGIVLLEIIK